MDHVGSMAFPFHAEGGSGKQPLDSHKYRCYAVIVHHGRSMTQVRRRDEERKEEK